MSSGLLQYPFGGGGYLEDNCGCAFHCYPQIKARFDAAWAYRAKVGFSEDALSGYVGPVSSPPRYYLRRLITWLRHTNDGNGNVTFESRWRLYVVDTSTGLATETQSSAWATDWAYDGAGFESETVTKTTRRAVYVNTGAPPITDRVEVIETLSDEYTTERLLADTLAAIPAWSAFPATAPEEATRYYVQSGVCYSGGTLFDAENLIVPAARVLAADETTCRLQRMRYRLSLPSFPGGTFTLDWAETFMPADGGAASTVATGTATGTTGDDETAILVAIDPTANGEVRLTGAVYSALAA